MRKIYILITSIILLSISMAGCAQKNEDLNHEDKVQAPNLMGTVLEVEDEGMRILVESRSKTINGQIWLTISEDTNFFENNSEDIYIGYNDVNRMFEVGNYVEIIVNGPIMESYPMQATATAVCVNNKENDLKTIENIVEAFGKKMQTVSLLAPTEVLQKSLQENYGNFVSPELLEEWMKNPKNAPGRMVSSPWPDRIEILSIEKVEENAYEVTGEIIEITSIDEDSDEFAAKRPITLVLRKVDDRWTIETVV